MMMMMIIGGIIISRKFDGAVVWKCCFHCEPHDYVGHQK